MSTSAAPKRCLDALPENDALRRALGAAVRDRPEVDLDRVYRGVIAIGGGAIGAGLDGGGGAGAGDVAGGAGIATGATKLATTSAKVASGATVGKVGGGLLASGALAKTFVIGIFGAASVGTAYWISRESEPEHREPARITAPAPIVSASAAAIVAPTAATPAVAPSAAPPPSAAAPPGAAPARVDEETEMSLLREAGTAISSDPARALALVDEAERRFPRGALGQEREVIRIQALTAAGRRDEALQRARAFLARTPSSAHRPRLEQILPELAGP